MINENVVKIEANILNDINKYLITNNVRGKVLFVTGENVYNIYGKNLEKNLKEIVTVDSICINGNDICLAMSIAEYILSNDIDVVLALGGGKVLDVSKYAAYISKKPLISVPTTISNDGIASPISVLKSKSGITKSLGCRKPNIILIDTKVIINSPIKLIQAGIGDTISNYMALKDWKFAYEKKKEDMNDIAYLMSDMSLKVLMEVNKSDISEEFVKLLANSLVISGVAMDLAKSSRPVSGSEHLFSHALDFYTKSKNLHGIQVAFCTIAMLKILKMDYSSVMDYLTRYNININPLKLNISKDEFIYCMKNAKFMRKNRYTYLNEIELTNIYLEKIYIELMEEL